GRSVKRRHTLQRKTRTQTSERELHRRVDRCRDDEREEERRHETTRGRAPQKRNERERSPTTSHDRGGDHEEEEKPVRFGAPVNESEATFVRAHRDLCGHDTYPRLSTRLPTGW